MFYEGNATGAIRDGDYKLIIATESAADWFGITSDGHFTPPRTGSQNLTKTACSPLSPCLFNINLDPEERNDISSTSPDIVANLLAIFHSYDTQHHPPTTPPPYNAAACCTASNKAGGILAPWG